MVTRFYLFILLLISVSALAAEVTVTTDRDPVNLSEPFRIIFTTSGQQDSEPDFSPLNKDFQLLGTGQSSSFSMVNGAISSSKTYTLTVMANREGKLTIPPINFGKDKSPAYQITVSASSQANPTVPGPPQSATTAAPGEQLFINAAVDVNNPYIQQQVILNLKIYRRIDWADANLSDPEFDGAEVVVQQLGKEKTYETNLNGKRYLVTELRYALFPQDSGELTIKPFSLTAKVRDDSSKRSSPFGNRGFNDPFFDDLFSRSTYKILTAKSKAIRMDVKAIPGDFSGGQWLPAKDIQLQETWSGDIKNMKAGEPVTRTIALIADGLGVSQLPEIEQRGQQGLKTYPDQPDTTEQATSKGLLSTVTQKLAVIPSHGGQFQLPAIEIPWWNTTTNRLELAKIPSLTLSVSGAASAGGQQKTMPDKNPPENISPKPRTPAIAQQDEAIPYLWLIVACAALLILWLITLVAWHRSRRRPPSAQAAHVKVIEPTTRSEALKQLKSACDKNSAKDVRDTLIVWARATWRDDPPTNLDELSRRVSEGLAKEISALSESLYSPKQTPWDPKTIYYLTNGYNTEQGSTTIPETLEPLYR